MADAIRFAVVGGALFVALPVGCGLEGSGSMVMPPDGSSGDDGDDSGHIGPPDAMVYDARPPRDGSTSDGGGAKDSSSGVDSGGVDAAGDDSSTVNCDIDGDGFTGPQCSGNDCCDTDNLANPGQGSYFIFPTLCGGFDFDCDGTEEHFWPDVNCSGMGSHCAGDGVASGGACGAFLDYLTCSFNAGSCNQSASGTRQQACR